MRSVSRKATTAAMAATIAGAALATPFVTAPVADAKCQWRNNKIWCPQEQHPRPSPQRFRLRWPDPRPPLTPKNSVWCTTTLINMGNGYGWYLIGHKQIRKRAWPDYAQRTYVSVVWNGTGWIQPSNPIYERVDCDV